MKLNLPGPGPLIVPHYTFDIAVAPPVHVTLARPPKPLAAQRVRYWVGDPAVIGFGPPVKVTLAKQRVRTRTVTTLGAPGVVHPPSPVGGPIRALVPKPRVKPVQYRLSPPATLVPPAQPPTVTQLRVTLARTPRKKTISTLRGPVVVGAPAALPAPVLVRLALQLPKRPVRYRLSPPAVLATPTPPFAPVRVNLAQQKLVPHGTISILGSPTVVQPPFVPPPAVVTGTDDITPVLVTEW